MDILDKVKKLLALSSSPNPNEAAAALSKARALMDEHAISYDDLIESDIKESSGRPYKAKNMPYHLDILSLAVAELFSCKVYQSTRWSHTVPHKLRGFEDKFVSYPVFVGYEPSNELCKYCYDNLVRKLTKARNNYISGSSIRSQISKDKDAYAFGWVHGVRNNIKHLIPPTIEIEISGEKGLIKVDPLGLYLDNKQLDEKSSKGVDEQNPATYRGFIDGQETKVNKGMGASSGNVLQLT